MIEPVNLLRAGIVNMSDAALLVCCGRAGIVGVTTVDAAGACRLPHNTAHHCLARLRELGLVCAPTRDTGQGRVNRHVIAPAGLALLQAPRETGAKPATQLPIEFTNKRRP